MNIVLDQLGLVLPGGHRALDGISLAIAAGERVAVIGPSGAGKTSLLRVLGTGLRPSSGQLRIDGDDPWQLTGPGLQRLRTRIGTVHQSPPLPPRQRLVTAVLAGRLGVWGFWRGLASLVYPADIPGAHAALGRLDLADRVFDRCDRLSGGQLQRVGVARVLYQQPDLMLADEPVSALDPQLADRTLGELHRDAVAREVTLVASLHAVDLALKWFSRVIGLQDGRVAFDAPSDQVSDQMLRDLYGVGTDVLPTLANAPQVAHSPMTPRPSLPRAGAQPLCR
jgi:phosphonate transport system ATP-binding protein